MTTPATTPISTQAAAPTAAAPTVPETTSSEGLKPEFELSPADLIYVLASYFYIHASNIGYEALKALNPNLVIINSLSNKDVADAQEQGEAAVNSADAESIELEQLADPDDTSDEADSAGASSDNPRYD